MGYYEEISEVIVNADYLLKNLMIKLSPIYKKLFNQELIIKDTQPLDFAESSKILADYLTRSLQIEQKPV
ncbi:MAG: hypothetical protein ACYDEJ_06300 [Desulfitobacteriaceae bacterium]